MLTNCDILDVGGGGKWAAHLLIFASIHVLFNDNLTFAVARSVRHGLERVEEAGEGGDGGDQLDLETVGLGDQELEQRQTRLRQREVSKDRASYHR